MSISCSSLLSITGTVFCLTAHPSWRLSWPTPSSPACDSGTPACSVSVAVGPRWHPRVLSSCAWTPQLGLARARGGGEGSSVPLQNRRSQPYPSPPVSLIAPLMLWQGGGGLRSLVFTPPPPPTQGSTIMLLTIPWCLSIVAGRVDIKDGYSSCSTAYSCNSHGGRHCNRAYSCSELLSAAHCRVLCPPGWRSRPP